MQNFFQFESMKKEKKIGERNGSNFRKPIRNGREEQRLERSDDFMEKRRAAGIRCVTTAIKPAQCAGLDRGRYIEHLGGTTTSRQSTGQMRINEAREGNKITADVSISCAPRGGSSRPLPPDISSPFTKLSIR